MAKAKTMSGSKKREGRAKLSSGNASAQNGVGMVFTSHMPADKSSAMTYSNKSKHENLANLEGLEQLNRSSRTTPILTSASVPNSNAITYEGFPIPKNTLGNIPHHQDINANLNVSMSQYYFLTKLMHQQKQILEPDPINVKRNETSTSNNVTCTTTNTSPPTLLSTRHGMMKTTYPDGRVIDYSNINVQKVEEPASCQCHLKLDPYPNPLSFRPTPNLQHYCRVCNTQLNSCKQAQIHTEGNKHEKRLTYLKFSLDTGAENDSRNHESPQASLQHRDYHPEIEAPNYTMPPKEVSVNNPYRDNRAMIPPISSSKLLSGSDNRITKLTGVATNSSYAQQQHAHPNDKPSISIPTETSLAHFVPNIYPSIAPPPMLPPDFGSSSATESDGGTNQQFIPSFVPFPTAPSGTYYIQQPTSSAPLLQVPPSTVYGQPISNGPSKASVENDYQKSYLSGLSTPNCGGNSDDLNSNTGSYHYVSSTSNSIQTNAGSIISHQPVSAMSSQAAPSVFPATIMSAPFVPASSVSLASINGNINDTSAAPTNSTTLYHTDHPINSSEMTFQETNQSNFSQIVHHGLPLSGHRQSTTNYNKSNPCQTQNAIAAPFYDLDTTFSYDNSNHIAPSTITVPYETRNTNTSVATKSFKDKRASTTLCKTNVKKFPIGMGTKSNRNCHGKIKSDVDSSQVPGENSDGYMSSVSHSSINRISSSQRRSLSSSNGTNKLGKGASLHKPLVMYQNHTATKSKPQKCQSLDRSSDSDFTSNLSGNSSKVAGINSSITTCDLCKLTFPSHSVLDNHLKGSRHIRRVKSQQAFRQLQDNGTNLGQTIIHEDGTFEDGLHFGEICCEVCEVSVNSSHQLQAHLAGHKHKVRCFRRGLHPSTAILASARLVNSSSTPPSTAPSECSSTMPRSAASFKYNPLSTSQYDTGTTTSSNNSYCLSNGTKSEGSRGGKKAGNNKKSLLGEPPALHPSILQSPAMLNSTTIPYTDSQGDGLLPLPDNIKPLGMIPNMATLFSTTNNVHQAMSYGASLANKFKSTKKVGKPSRNISSTVRRYSTTESDDQTDSAKNKTNQDISEKEKNAVSCLHLESGSSISKKDSMNYLNQKKKPLISLESDDTSSSIAGHDSTAISFSMQALHPIALPHNDTSIQEKLESAKEDNGEGNNSYNNDCNTSFLSSSDEAKESSEPESERVASICQPLCSIKSILDGATVDVIDNIIPVKNSTSNSMEVPKSPTTKQYTSTIGAISTKSASHVNLKCLNKTAVAYSCDMCNVIVNSSAQLTQHMNSPRHHVKVADCKTKADQQKKEEQQKQHSDNSKLKEIPMLNMFLKTLQPPSTLPPIQPDDPLKNSTSTCSSGGNSQYFSSDKEGEGDSSSNTEVER